MKRPTYAVRFNLNSGYSKPIVLVTTSSLLRITSNLPLLKSLILSGQNLDIDSFIPSLQTYSSLIEGCFILFISGETELPSYPVTPFSIFESLLSNCPNLEFLDCSKCSWMTIDIVSFISTNNKSIRILNILVCPNIPKNVSLLYYYMDPTALNSALKYRLIKSIHNSAHEHMENLEDQRMMRNMDRNFFMNNMDRFGLRARERMDNMEDHHMMHNMDRFGFAPDMDNLDEDPMLQNVDRFGLLARQVHMENFDHHHMMMHNMDRRARHIENLVDRNMMPNVDRVALRARRMENLEDIM
jgi:hypothetical protein